MDFKDILKMIYSQSDHNRLLNDNSYFINCMVNSYNPAFKSDYQLMQRAIESGACKIIYQYIQQGITPNANDRSTFIAMLQTNSGFSLNESSRIVEWLFYMVGWKQNNSLKGTNKSLLISVASCIAAALIGCILFFVIGDNKNRIVGTWEIQKDMSDEIEGILIKRICDNEGVPEYYVENVISLDNIVYDLTLTFKEDGKCKIKAQPHDTEVLEQKLYDTVGKMVVSLLSDALYYYGVSANDVSSDQWREAILEYIKAVCPSESLFLTQNYYYMVKNSKIYLSESAKATDTDSFIIIGKLSRNVLELESDPDGIIDMFDFPITFSKKK